MRKEDENEEEISLYIIDNQNWFCMLYVFVYGTALHIRHQLLMNNEPLFDLKGMLTNVLR